MKTLSPEQISRAQRAADQRHDYSLRHLDVAGCRCVEVTKTKDGATYLVSFTGDLPVCSCEDNRRHPEFVCKHGVLSVVYLRDQAREQPATLTPERRAQALKDRELLWA